MARKKCPKCNSSSLYIPVSVEAKMKYNTYDPTDAIGGKVYGVNKKVIDNYFWGCITCEKCGWGGDESELV